MLLYQYHHVSIFFSSLRRITPDMNLKFIKQFKSGHYNKMAIIGLQVYFIIVIIVIYYRYYCADIYQSTLILFSAR